MHGSGFYCSAVGMPLCLPGPRPIPPVGTDSTPAASDLRKTLRHLHCAAAGRCKTFFAVTPIFPLAGQKESIYIRSRLGM